MSSSVVRATCNSASPPTADPKTCPLTTAIIDQSIEKKPPPDRTLSRIAGEIAPRDCPACAEVTAQRFLYSLNGCNILQCRTCGLGQAETSAFDPVSYYTGKYFSGQQSDGYADYLASERVLRTEFARAVAFIRQWCDGGRLLEVGCAYGFFLHEAKKYFDVSGIELAAHAAMYCQRSGLSVLPGVADESTLNPNEKLDVIVMLDVIEHLPDPRGTLALLSRHLNPGGIVVITTGDFGSVAARLCGRHWRLMTPPQHLWFFGRESIVRLAASLGLKVERVDHPWKIVPLSLIIFQLRRMLNLSLRVRPPTAGVGLPLNFFDAMRVVLRKPSS
jgi:2-polyprenyl-3-methyl-5-hydroxy-6-metoxy-1,4-benzoquinol methylase